MDNQSFLKQLKPIEQNLESFQQETFETVKKNYIKPIILILFLLVISYGGWLLINQPISMGDFIGKNVQQVQLWAEKNQIDLEIVWLYHEDIKAEMVISQSVLADTKLTDNQTLVVEVSLGIDLDKVIALPDFDQTWNKEQIVQWVLDNKLTNYQFINQKNADVAVDTLIAFEMLEDVFTRSTRIIFTIASE